MKILISSDQFKSVVALCERMTGKNLSLPVLGGLLLTVSGKNLLIRATNLNLGIECELSGQGEEDGSVLIGGLVLQGIVHHLPAGEKIKISTEGDNLILKTKKSKQVVKAMPRDDFPTLPRIEEGTTFSFEAKHFIEGVKTIAFCAATSEVKPEIAALYCYTSDNELVVVATDSFRLGEKRIKAKQIPDITQLLIPSKNIGEILRVVEYLRGEITITFNKNLISFKGAGVVMTSRLIDGLFPDYRQIIPKETTTQCVILKEDLLNTLRLSTVFSDKFQQVVFSVNPQEKKVTLSSKSAEVGETTTALEGVIKGPEIEVQVNLRYFIDVLQAITGDSVSIEFTEPHRPLIIKCVSDHSVLYLLMPLNR